MKIVVIGGTGLIGSKTVAILRLGGRVGPVGEPGTVLPEESGWTSRQ